MSYKSKKKQFQYWKIYANIQEIKINNIIKEILIFNSIENDLIN